MPRKLLCLTPLVPKALRASHVRYLAALWYQRGTSPAYIDKPLPLVFPAFYLCLAPEAMQEHLRPRASPTSTAKCSCTAHGRVSRGRRANRGPGSWPCLRSPAAVHPAHLVIHFYPRRRRRYVLAFALYFLNPLYSRPPKHQPTRILRPTSRR